MKKKFPILYKYTNKKQVQQWQIVVVKNSFYTKEGIQDGVLTESKPTYCKPKNVGKSATVKYFNRTPANKPRFPYIVKLSREDYE